MENLGGALGFRATLNIDDFNVSAQSMERQIRNFSNTAISEVGEVEDSFRKMAESAGRYISYYLVGQGMHGLVNSIIQTRGQFQQLEIAFETMLGSTDKATTLMQQMVDTAAKTPFDLMGVAEGAKQLMAYGVSADKVNDTLVRLGNIASGLSIPLNDIVYLYGTTMVQGRLYAQDVRQFTGRGIPLVKELAEKYHTTADAINEMVSAGKIGFADVEEVLNKMTNSGGQFYNLMEKQSASLTGQIANLQDAWDTVLNDWGKSNEGLFSGAIAGATYLVEHMDTLVRILKAVAIGYGSVKAAIVLNSVATKGYTGIAVIDNTVRSAKLVLMKAEAALNGTALAQKKAMTAAKTAQTAATNILSAATGKLSTMFKALWATLRANPFGWLLTIIGAVWSLITMFSNDTEKTTDVMEEFSEGTKKVTDKLDLYFAILSKAEKNGKTYRDMIAKINEICQEYNATLLDENATLKEQEARYLEVKAAVQATTAEKIKAKRIEEELNKLNEKGDTNYDSFETRLNNLQYRTGKTKTINDKKHGESYEVEIQEAAENIQNAVPEVREAIRSLVESGAQELAKLSGSEYTQKYNEIIAQIVAGTKAGTGATEREMQSFEAQLRLYLDNQIRDVQVYDKAIALVDERLNNFLAPKDTSATEGITDYAQMSFEDLDNLVTQTQKDIDAINNSTVGPGADTTGLDTLLSKLAEIKGAIQTKTDNLNTEQGISDRIKQLKQERAETEINSTRYKELNKEISKLEGKMPKHTTGGGGGANNAARNAETLRQKQVDAERRVEEARIAVMEEGYDKRKALLDLQHKQNLAQIEREEKELIEARKKAGKGGLSDTEKQGFEQRRTYENQSYTQSQNKLFEGELDYKRKQYELYWRWVENMGKDVADKQFASLLQSGGSYKEYIEKQIAELQGKKQAGVLTEGEGNFLISLNVQYDELTGARTALEAFKQAVSETIGRSQTLAEKLEAVADAKRKLENGESGIVNDDDRAAMSLELSKQEADLQKQVHETVLNDYRTFEEQRKSITEEYALLRAEAERMGDEERIKLINKAETEALSALNTGFLLQTDSWKKLFSDLDTLSVGQIQKLVSDIDKQLAAGTLKLSPVDYKAVIESLNQAKQRIQELNPFAALDTFFNDYLKAKQKLAKAKAALAKGEGSKEDVESAEREVESAEREVKSAANGITQSVEKVTDITTDCASSLQSMFDALGMDGVSDGIGTAIELMGELGNAAASVGQFMAGDVVGGITGMISSITSVIGIFAKMHDAKYEKKIQNLQKQIDALERSYSRLERAFNNTYWVFNDEERAGFERNIQLIEDQIAALEQQRQTARRAWDFAQYAQLTAQIKDLNQQLSKAKEGDDMLGLYEQQKASLREQQELMKQQIQAERDKKKTDNDKIQQWNDAIEQIEQQIEDLDRQMMETFAGTTTKEALDQYADAIVDAYCAGEDAAKALGDTTREVLKKAVVDALKRNFLAKAMDDAIQYLGEAMSDGELTAREKSKFEALVNAAGATFTNALEAVGDWIKDIDDEATSSDPLTGAVTSMSEETGGVIAGRLNAFIINQTDQTSVMRQQLLQQSAIVQNTATANVILAEVRDTLKRIETKDNSLLSQGIS